MLKTKEGMPSGASPSLVAWVFLEYYLGVPWASPSLGSFHSLFSSYRYLTQSLKTSITQNLTELRDIGSMIKSKPFTLVLSKIRFIIVLTQCLLYHIISTIYNEKYIIETRKQANYAMKTESVRNRIVCNDLNTNHTSATPKIMK